MSSGVDVLVNTLKSKVSLNSGFLDCLTLVSLFCIPCSPYKYIVIYGSKNQVAIIIAEKRDHSFMIKKLLLGRKRHQRYLLTQTLTFVLHPSLTYPSSILKQLGSLLFKMNENVRPPLVVHRYPRALKIKVNNHRI